MKNKKGVVLIQVMVMSCILFMMCGMLVNWSLQMTITRRKVVQGIAGFSELEKVRAQIWGCLSDKGYPSTSCSLNTAEQVCVPSSVVLEADGTVPNCHLILSVTK
jgi:hypothetical protein